MHDVVCDKCGKECQVPFKPSGDKPVLCSDCFKASGEGGRSRSSSGGVSSEEISKINAKLDKIIELLGSLEVVDEDEETEESEEEK
jgi:CxxC-x17-CxxC domain-containing protein